MKRFSCLTAKHRKTLLILLCATVCVILLLLAHIAHSLRSNHASIGIIGGADGPTSIYVSTSAK